MTEHATSPPRLYTAPFMRVLAMQLAFGFSWSTFLLLPKYLTTELGASAVELGTISAVPTIAAACAVPFVGPWLDRVGRRRMITLGCTLATLYAFGFLAVTGIGPLLIGLQLIQGLSFVIAFNAAATLVTELTPPERLGQALGTFGASNVVMNAIAPGVAELVAARSGWHGTFVMSGVAGLLAIALSRTLEDRKPGVVARAQRPTFAPDRELLHYVIVMALNGGAFATVFTFYQPFALGQGATEVGAFFMGFALAVVVTRIGLGSFVDRIGRQRVARAAAGLYVLVLLALPQMVPATLIVYGFAFGVAHGFLYPALNALAVENCAAEARGKAMTYANGGFQVGYALCALAFGVVAEQVGYAATFFCGAFIAACSVVMLSRRAPAPAIAAQRG